MRACLHFDWLGHRLSVALLSAADPLLAAMPPIRMSGFEDDGLPKPKEDLLVAFQKQQAARQKQAVRDTYAAEGGLAGSKTPTDRTGGIRRMLTERASRASRGSADGFEDDGYSY